MFVTKDAQGVALLCHYRGGLGTAFYMISSFLSIPSLTLCSAALRLYLQDTVYIANGVAL
jgi:hypothetical protein